MTSALRSDDRLRGKVAKGSPVPPSEPAKRYSRAPKTIEPLLPLVQARNAFSRSDDARCCHLGTGYFLDLAGGAGAVVDQDALAQSQIDDVLLARNLLRHGRWRECAQRKAPKQQNRRSPDR